MNEEKVCQVEAMQEFLIALKSMKGSRAEDGSFSSDVFDHIDCDRFLRVYAAHLYERHKAKNDSSIR